MKRYGILAAGLMSLYLLNRFLLIPCSGGLLHRLLSGHFADFLAGGMMVLILFAALHLANRPLPGPAAALGFALFCGLFWEVVTPLYLPRSVGDPWDVLAVVLGGGCILSLLSCKKSNSFDRL